MEDCVELFRLKYYCIVTQIRHLNEFLILQKSTCRRAPINWVWKWLCRSRSASLSLHF